MVFIDSRSNTVSRLEGSDSRYIRFQYVRDQRMAVMG